MANPSDEACAADTWTKVATAVTSCNITSINNVHHQVAIRENPSVAPTSATDGEFLNGAIAIRHSVSVDVWVLAVGATGAVRVYA